MKKNENYSHKDVEQKWQKAWEDQGIYHAKLDKKKKKFFSLIEFPYPSGAGLHVGHVRSNTAMDVISRKRRMEGYNVLYPIGWDAFGLPTENYAIKTGIAPAKVTKQNTDVFRRQLKSIGFSFDWSREVNTTDPAYFKWTQWIFLQLYKKGLAYKAKTEINWCLNCKIGLANEEVVGGKCERCGGPVEKRQKEQWMLAITKYADRLDRDLDTVDYLEKIKIQQRNWIGKSEGSEIEFPLVFKNSFKKKILIGTRNEAKFRMVMESLPELPEIEFVSLNDIPAVDDSALVEGMDFVANAKMKSEFYFQKTGIPTISLDNVFWLEKWKKDNGIMVHMRKEANPKSDRATDEEVIAFLKSWVKKVGGKSKARFMYAVAFTNSTGTQSFVSTQRDYILQEKQSANFWPGYPSESLLIDAKTKEYKGDQTNSVRYGALIADFAERTDAWFEPKTTVKVFTTRADTLFGATYVVLAPEHPWVALAIDQNHTDVLKNREEVAKYVALSKQKDDMERTADGKDKTGVELQGVKAIHPGTGEELPIFVADYVLAQYGTGAVMAVPAHDDRDFVFAKKYNLPMRNIIDPIFIRDDVKTTTEFELKRKIVSVVESPTGEILTVQWGPQFGGRLLLGGTIEEGETPDQTALRELAEETGYTDAEVIEVGEETYDYKYFAKSKGKAFQAMTNFVHIKLRSLAQKETGLEEDEKGKFVVEWMNKDRVQKEVVEVLHVYAFNKFVLGKPFTDEGIVARSGEFNGLTSAEARKKITEAVGGKMVTKYKLRDWVFSRQRYWGEPIPIVYCQNCFAKSKEQNNLKEGVDCVTIKQKKYAVVPLPEKMLPLELPKVKSYTPTDTGESPLAGIPSFVKTMCPTCKSPAVRETDTMPNWAGSSWYYLRYADPKNKKEFASKENLAYFMKNGVDWYNGGMEHTTLHLLYSRFWHKFLYDLKVVPTSEPYHKRTSHGMILAESGDKMSKSKGNVVNPDEIVGTYGADTLRVYEMFMGPFDQSVAWSTASMMGPRKFLERVWRLTQRSINTAPNTKTPVALRAALHKTIKKVTDDIETMGFNTAISAMMIFLNDAEKAETLAPADAKLFLKILAPFAPHLTEELWDQFGEKSFIHTESWPSYDKKLLVDDRIKIAVQVNGKVRDEIEIDADAEESIVTKQALSLDKVQQFIAGKEVKKVIYVKGRLVSIVAG